MADPVFSLTIDDTSPLVLYSPFPDTFGQPQTGRGWNPYYTDSGFASIDSGAGSPISSAIGNGTSLHITAADGAALQITWNGTDIRLYGTLVPISNDQSDTTYSVSLDGTATTNFLSSITTSSTVLNADTDLLVSFNGLQDGRHTLQLTFHNPDGIATAGNSTSGLVFDRAVVEIGAGMPNASPTPSSSLTSTAASPPTPSTTAVTAPLPDSETAFRGQWDFVTNLLPGSSATFHTSTNVGDRATLMFNGSAVGLTGLTTPDSGAFNVSLDNGVPVSVSGRASFTSSEPTLLFFRTGLDPSVMHAIEVINVGPAGAGDGAGSLLVLGAVNVTTIQPAASPAGAAKGSRLPRGAVAAIAIGVTLAVAALAAALFFFIRRRRRSNRRKRQMLVNPEISRARNLAFLFPHKRQADRDQQRGLEKIESGYGDNAVLDIRSATPEEKDADSDESEAGEGEGIGERRLSAAEKGKQRATQRSNNTSKNSDGSYSIELPDLTIAQVPRGYLPASAVPSTPSPPRTLIPSPTSPRSPARPRGPRDLPLRDAGTRSILLSNLPPPPEVQVTDESELAPPIPAYLPETHISPLRVEFAPDVQSRPEGRTERTISTGAISLPPSLKQALAQQQPPVVLSESSEPPEPPSPTRTSRLYSFLDFSSTSSSLSRSQRQSASNSTGKSRSSSRSKRGSEHESPQTVNWASLPPDRRISLGLSMTVGAATASRPSLSPNISLHPVPLSQSAPTLSTSTERPLPSPDTPAIEGPDQDFPYDTNQLPSPTDSIPYTVSDIHFRHSTHSSVSMPAESRRTSAYRWSGSHRPPHPPLPSAGPSPTRASHRRGGSQSGSQSVPPLIVQRLLGRATGSNPASPFGSPITPQFGSMQGMTAAAHATSSLSPTPPRGSSGPPTPTVQVPGTPTQAAPGSSTTTVFGFQLGRRGERS